MSLNNIEWILFDEGFVVQINTLITLRRQSRLNDNVLELQIVVTILPVCRKEGEKIVVV